MNSLDTETIPNQFLDLENFISNYNVFARIHRLEYLFSKTRNITLAYDAQLLAIKEVQKTADVQKFITLCKNLESFCAQYNKPLPNIDLTWADSIKSGCNLELEELDKSLRTSKNKQIATSIYMSYCDLGDYYYKCGNFSSALKQYELCKNHTSSEDQVTQRLTNLIKVHMAMNNVQKTSLLSDRLITSGRRNSYILSIAGLYKMQTEEFSMAAHHFVDCSIEAFDNNEMWLSVVDVGTYGGLCALANYDRDGLKALSKNTSFKEFLESAPVVRDMIDNFYRAKYKECIITLNLLKDELLLDIYACKVASKLLSNIRTNAIIQYVRPYSSLDLNKMASAFQCSVDCLETELGALILDGKIEARIDSSNRILLCGSQLKNDEQMLYTSAIEMAESYKNDTTMFLLKTAMLRENVQIQSKLDLDNRKMKRTMASHHSYINKK